MSTTAKTKLQTASIIHWALVIPMMLFGAFCFYKNTLIDTHAKEELTILIYLPLLLMVIAIIAGRFFYQNTLKNIEDKSLDDKLQHLTTAIIIRGALFEMAGITAGVASFLTGNNVILLLVPIIILQFYINRPTLLKVETDLKATRDELDQFDS